MKTLRGAGAVALITIGLGACTAAQSGPLTAGTRPRSPTCASAKEIEIQLLLISSRGGEATPTMAARSFAFRGGWPHVSVPTEGWHQTGQGSHTATVHSGKFALTVVQGTDGTWQVDGGRHCL
jgi:hypothetical protein